MEIAALNQLDIFILSIIVVSAIISLFRGFVKEAFSLILWISAFFLTILFQPSAQKFLSNFSILGSLLEPLTYIIVFVSLIFIGGLVINFIHGLVQWSGLSGFNRLLGVMFGSLRGVLIVSLLFIVADDYVEQSTSAENSKIYPIIKTYNPILISKISSMIEDTNSGMLTSEQPILGNT